MSDAIPQPAPVQQELPDTAPPDLSSREEDIDAFVQEMVDRVEELSTDLIERERAWTTHRETVDAELAERARQLETERDELTARREQFNQEVRGQFQQQNEQVSSATQEIHGLAERLESLLDQLDRPSPGQADSVGPGLATLSEAILPGLDSQAPTQPSTDARAPKPDVPSLESVARNDEDDARTRQLEREVEALREEAEQVQSHLSNTEQERSALKKELESVRGGAAHLTEVLTERQRDLAGERAQWASDLLKLNSRLEHLAQYEETNPNGGDNGEAHRAEQGANQEEPSRGQLDEHADDQLVDSVVAQFARPGTREREGDVGTDS